MKKAAWIWWAAVALAVQVAALGWLVVRYERVLAKGEEIRVPCGAFDPRDPLRGRYLNVNAWLECECNAESTLDKDLSWSAKQALFRKMWAELQAPESPAGTHRLLRVAPEPEEEGLWVKPDRCHVSEVKNGRDCEIWNVRVTFPGKLFLDERLAGEADRIFAERLGERLRAAQDGDAGTARSEAAQPVAVYRAWKGQLVIADVELDGVSIRELARRAREEAAAKAGEKE